MPATGTCLSVGCGSGQTMAWLRSLYPRWRYVGLDVAAGISLPVGRTVLALCRAR